MSTDFDFLSSDYVSFYWEDIKYKNVWANFRIEIIVFICYTSPINEVHVLNCVILSHLVYVTSGAGPRAVGTERGRWSNW